MKVSPLQNIILTAAQEAVLSKLSPAGQAAPEVGEHKGSIAVHVDYSFEKLADEEYVPTVSIPYKAVLGLLLTHAPAMEVKLQEALNEAVTLKAKATAGCKTSKATLKSLTDDCPAPNANVDEFLADLPKSVRKGKIINLETEITTLSPSCVEIAVELQVEEERNRLKEELEAAEQKQRELKAQLDALEGH